jgi:uncharacterized phage protein (TIGR01671 family)
MKMREIKFRAWSKEGKRMIYQDENGWYQKAFIGRNRYWQTTRLSTIVNHPEIIPMQYTGVKDINGTEIFEGDILRIASNFELRKDVQNQAVEYREGYFHTFEWTLFELLRNAKVKKQTFEVIGNIYENQELLEESK